MGDSREKPFHAETVTFGANSTGFLARGISYDMIRRPIGALSQKNHNYKAVPAKQVSRTPTPLAVKNSSYSRSFIQWLLFSVALHRWQLLDILGNLLKLSVRNTDAEVEVALRDEQGG